MGEQLNYLNNLNRPNLVDMSLIQKINDYRQHNSSTPKLSYAYSLIQTAGSATFGIAKENVFISVIVISLILFLAWCYIEKQRQDALVEKFLQKKLAKSLLSDELNLFNETLSPLNVEKLFNDINTDLYVEKENNINKEPVIENMQNNNPGSVDGSNWLISKGLNTDDRQVHLTKREQNMKLFDRNQTSPTEVQGQPAPQPLENTDKVKAFEYSQFPSQGFPKGASRDFGQEFVSSPPPIVQQPIQPPQQQNFGQPQQQNQQAPMYKQALAQDGLVKQEPGKDVGASNGPMGTSRYMDISSGFNKNSYMLM
jgi:hypothetical protein